MNQEELAELVLACATDTDLFSHVFFPRTVRQASPAFHREMDAILDSNDRFVNMQVFRGGAKTTKFRILAAKRLAYLISRTILFVGKSQAHAERNLRWVRKQVERNDLYATTFGLRQGVKWTDEEAQVLVGKEETPVTLISLGITGSARGINVDDYRPDLILVDDVMDEENSSTPEQRQKVYKLVHGALKHSLAPASENPFAKLGIFQTPLDAADISELAKKDPQFRSVVYGCWTRETAHLPTDNRVSAWEARWSSEVLREERRAAIAKNELSLFSREMECKLIAPEDAEFRAEWLQFYGEGYDEPMPPMHLMETVLVIDPVPPPSEREVQKNLHGKDYEAISALGKYMGKIYLLESVFNRGHDPTWTAAEFFRLGAKWRPSNVIVEAVAYQKTLVWLLKQAMIRAGKYYPIIEYKDRRAKRDRIVDGIKPVASNCQLYVRPEQTEFIGQYSAYSDVPHDDVLETVAIGCEHLQGKIVAEHSAVMENEEEYERLEYQRGAP